MALFGYIIGNIVYAYSWIYDKMILSRERVSYKTFLVVVFFFASVFSFLLLPWLGSVNLKQFSPIHLWLFLADIILALFWNYLLQRAIQKESINSIQIYIWLNPLMTILIAGLLLAEGQNFRIYIASIISGGALIFAHLEKKHLKFENYSLFIFLAVIMMALEAVIFKILLDVMSPVALYSFRSVVIFLIFLFAYGLPKSGLSLKKIKELAIMGAMWVCITFFIFTGYKNLGVILTTLIFMISVIITNIFAYIFLNERFKKRYIIATIIIIAAIVYAFQIIS